MSAIQQLLISYNEEKVVWLGKTNVSEASDGGLTSTLNDGTGNWGGAGAYSSQSFASGNVKCEFTVNQLGYYGVMFGLSNATDAAANNHYSNIDFAAFLWVDSYIHCFQNGSSVATSSPTTAQIGDKVSVAVENGKVIYRLNQTIIYTNNSPTLSYPLKVDCALTGLNAKFAAPKIFR